MVERNPNAECRNPKQARNPNDENGVGGSRSQGLASGMLAGAAGRWSNSPRSPTCLRHPQIQRRGPLRAEPLKRGDLLVIAKALRGCPPRLTCHGATRHGWITHISTYCQTHSACVVLSGPSASAKSRFAAFSLETDYCVPLAL